MHFDMVSNIWSELWLRRRYIWENHYLRDETFRRRNCYDVVGARLTSRRRGAMGIYPTTSPFSNKRISRVFRLIWPRNLFVLVLFVCPESRRSAAADYRRSQRRGVSTSRAGSSPDSHIISDCKEMQMLLCFLHIELKMNYSEQVQMKQMIDQSWVAKASTPDRVTLL